MIDLHAHVLPGLDDGARNPEEAFEIVRSMADDGVEVVAATPHVRDDYPTTPEQMEQGVAQLRILVREAGIDLEILPGGEIALERLRALDEDALSRFGLGGNPRLLLIEFPYVGWPPALAVECARLRGLGIVPVLAHPERNNVVQERPGDLDALVRAGTVVQLTAASVDGRLGRAAAACAKRLLELELGHLLASDAHAPGIRQAGMSRAVEAIGDRALARWLTSSVPEALLGGDELPPRPARARSRRLRGLRAR